VTVGALKKLIATMPDNWQVLAPASDHSYRKADAAVEIVENDGGHYSEADTRTPQPEHEQALVIT